MSYKSRAMLMLHKAIGNVHRPEEKTPVIREGIESNKSGNDAQETMIRENNETQNDYLEAQYQESPELSNVAENFNKNFDRPVMPNISEKSPDTTSDLSQNNKDIVRTVIEPELQPGLQANILRDANIIGNKSHTRSSSSSSSSSSCTSDSSSSLTSSSDTERDPYSSDDSVKDPTYLSSDKENEENIETKTKSRKIKNPCTEEKIGKKRKLNPETWQKNVAKSLRNRGKSYVSSSIVKNPDGTKTKEKKERPAKTLLPACGNKCKFKCSENVKQDQRIKIFEDYWQLGNIEKQREFISSNMKTVEPKYKYSNVQNPRLPNNAYYFVADNKDIRVCTQFFMATLAINNRIIQTVIKKQKFCESGKVVESDRRGKHGNHHKVDEKITNGIRNHIQSIPRVESHYCPSHTKKEYIEGNKTLADLHRDYKKMCEEQNAPAGNYIMYCKIFNEQFNIAFHLPKKDQCELCLQYKNCGEAEKDVIREKYETHIMEKDLSRAEKERDKNSDNLTNVIVYDMQAVLPCPTGDASSFYYVSKLNVLNFTLYDIKRNKGTCYLWHEGEAQRGANEIGSCIFNYLKKISEEHNRTDEEFNVIFYSDNCCGQNKNKFIIALYMYMLFSLNVKSITHKFFISGHSQSEGDSVHATIEREIKKYKKGSPIYAPEQYACIIRGAKKTGTPYTVEEFCHKDILDLKSLAADLFINIPHNLKLTEIRVLKLEKQNPSSLLYKTSYSQLEFDRIEIVNTRKKLDIKKVNLKPAYTKKTGISEAKKNGLIKLIEKKKCVPMYYLNYYKNL